MTDRPLADRIALVTGATRGIGAATALALAKAGAHVIAVGRTEGALEEVDDAIKAEGGSATLVPMDVTDYEAIDRLGGAIYQRWGHLDVFVGNAGILGPVTPLGHVDPKDWDQALSVNLTANYRFVRSLDPLL
ncbi:MAG: oxidoreductase, partial [Azorhizobium sp. 12-66-6]